MISYANAFLRITHNSTIDRLSDAYAYTVYDVVWCLFVCLSHWCIMSKQQLIIKELALDCSLWTLYFHGTYIAYLQGIPSSGV